MFSTLILRHLNQDWQKKYGWYWRELYMSYDFLKSVKPNQINFNSESHLLSSEHSRDLYMNPKYARATYWAAHTLGLNATQTWYWPRRLNGSLRKGLTGSYGGSNNQQPRVTFELESTLIDLNTFLQLFHSTILQLLIFLLRFLSLYQSSLNAFENHLMN